MAWAKIDDGWWCHPKTMQLTVSAAGLWALALSWSCQQRRDVIPPRFLAMVEAHEDHAKELVDAGFWHETPDGWRIHDWSQFQERPAKEASDSGSYGNHVRWHVNRGVTDDECEHCHPPESPPESPPTSDATPNAIAPVPSRPNPEETPSSPDGDREATETGAEEVPRDDAPDDDQRFEEHFWPIYPRMPNGTKPEKGKALQQWRKLTLDQQRRAVRGAKNLASADTIPKHAHRFLRKDTAGEFPFDDYQQDTAPGTANGAVL